jgi:YD repeat-containing protein
VLLLATAAGYHRSFGSRTSWTYYNADRVTAEVDPRGKSTLYDYDAASKRIGFAVCLMRC